MTKNISNTLDIHKVTSALAKRLPDKKGPWRYEKTLFGQSNPTFILTGKNSKLVLRKKPSLHLLEENYGCACFRAKPWMMCLANGLVECQTPI